MAVLYRKYRSKSLDELVGQDHITRALSSAIKSDSIAHAYLFTGPRGTGKTSVARILAYEINGIPYDEKGSHLDIIEIDAASNRRIDEIRDLRDKVHIAPTSAKYKVYIIDEVHMLTKEAFNALLKTLEEPPEHAVFILATTELQKVPDTIISRTQRFSFKPIEREKIIEHLATIAKKEKINITDEALDLIARHSTGGFRDAISLLDQVKQANAQVTVDAVRDLIGMPSSTLIDTIWGNLVSGKDASIELQKLYEEGYQSPLISKALLERAVMEQNVVLARALLHIPASHDPNSELLLLLLEHAPQRPQPQIHKEEEPISDTPKPAEAPQKSQAESPKRTLIETSTTTPPKKVDEVKMEDTEVAVVEAIVLWEKILEEIKDGKHAVYGPLRLAKADVEGSKLRLGLAFPFHVKRVSEAKNIELLTTTATKHSGQDMTVEVYRITTETVEPPKQRPIEAIQPTKDSDAELMTDPLSMIKNVFGDAQVL